MSDLLIKSMEMPKEDTLIVLSPDGTVTFMDHTTAHAVEIPPHGDLIDRNQAHLRFGELAEKLEEKNGYEAGAPYAMSAMFLNNTNEFPTIIPTSEGET